MYHHLLNVGAIVLFVGLSLPPSSAAEPLQLAQAPEDLVALPPLDPADVIGLSSIHADVPTSVFFTNILAQAVTVWWIDHFGAEVFYDTIGGLQSYEQQTFVTHPWLIRTQQSGTALVGFLPAAQQGIASIVDLSEAPAPIPEPSTLY